MKCARFQAAALVLVSTLSAGAARAADSVTLRLDWVYGTEHWGTFTALEKGSSGTPAST